MIKERYYVIKDRFKFLDIPESTTTNITDNSIVYKTEDKEEAIKIFKEYYMGSKRYKLWEVTKEEDEI